MVLQREDDGRPAGLAGDLPEAAQQVPVTPVHPVEDADGHGGIPSVPLLCDLAHFESLYSLREGLARFLVNTTLTTLAVFHYAPRFFNEAVYFFELFRWRCFTHTLKGLFYRLFSALPEDRIRQYHSQPPYFDRE